MAYPYNKMHKGGGDGKIIIRHASDTGRHQRCYRVPAGRHPFFPTAKIFRFNSGIMTSHPGGVTFMPTLSGVWSINGWDQSFP